MQTETKTETPVLLDRLQGGRAIVRVGDIVTPRERNGTWGEATVKGFTADGLRADVSLPNGEPRCVPLDLWLLSSGSELQARAQLESIKEMVAALVLVKNGLNDENDLDAARGAIQQDPLEVTVRLPWMRPNAGEYGSGPMPKPEEFQILLCTGGPACRIIGELNEHCEPEKARLEHQDWGTPWTEYRVTAEDEQALIAYASEFVFA